jgi:hypothetical protein
MTPAAHDALVDHVNRLLMENDDGIKAKMDAIQKAKAWDERIADIVPTRMSMDKMRELIFQFFTNFHNTEFYFKFPNKWRGIIRRCPSLGTFMGYVEIPVTHPWAIADYFSINVEVHGGLTYSAPVTGNRIPLLPIFGKKRVAWRIGFDCNHYCDLIVPLLTTGEGQEGRTYKGPDFVLKHVIMLWLQARDAEHAKSS